MNAQVTKADLIEKVLEYKPLGESETIKLSIAVARQWMIKPTKKGIHATDQDVMQFIMLCKARELNPWVGDAYCVGYDSDGGATFNLITSVQALFKRAESHPEFDGIESGVIVKKKNGEVIECEGDWHEDEDRLVGGWARVYRKDRSKPFAERIKFSTFNKGFSVWKSDPEGMISKCAEAGALRKAFPTQLGGLYLREEMDSHQTIEGSATTVVQNQMDELSKGLAEKRQAIGHTQSAPDLSQQLEAAKAHREQAETVKAPSTAQEETKSAEAAQSETVSTPKVEHDIVADYKAQFEKCSTEEEARVLCTTVKRSKKLTEDQIKYLCRVGNERLHTLMSQ